MEPHLTKQDDICTFSDSSTVCRTDGSGSLSAVLHDRETEESINSPPIDQQESVALGASKTLSSEEEKVPCVEDEADRLCPNAHNQLVVYQPPSNACTGEAPADPNIARLPPPTRSRNQASRGCPSVGAFTVQCKECLKWRLIPSKEKYEQIRAKFTDQPFTCARAREWRPEISCDDDADIVQDGRLWAIDKPDIAETPRGWERVLRIRAEGGTKFADVYYIAPSGKRLRSMVEVDKYLKEHENEANGASSNQFSFLTPKPLQEDYVRRRPARSPGVEAIAADPVSMVSPDENTGSPYDDAEPDTRPAKRARTPSAMTGEGARD